MCAQISQNPRLTKLNMPMLEAIGGPLIIANNSALTTLASLDHLAVVNATGRSAPAFGLPSLPVSHPFYTLHSLLFFAASATLQFWRT